MAELPLVFGPADALRAGYTAAELRARLRGRVWVTVRRGMYCSAETMAGAGPRARHALLARAVLRSLGRPAWVSHCSAAYLLGLPVPPGEPRRLYVTATSGGRRSRADVEFQVAAMPGDHRHEIDEIALTSPSRTVIDLARHLATRDAVAIGDAALHLGLTDMDRLAATLDACVSWPGITAARIAVDGMDGRRESWLESISAAMFTEHALPPPEPQAWIADAHGPFARVDFLWEPPGVIGEADGAVKYEGEDPSPLLAEKLRQERLEALGYTIVRWSAGDVLVRPYQLARRIQAAHDRAWRARAAGVPLQRFPDHCSP